LDDEWAEIFYTLPSDQQAERFKDWLPRVQAFKAQYPGRAEPLVIEAVTLCTLAAADWGFDSLSRINQARQLLEKSIGIDPKAMEGTALISLGNLFYRLPGWPISFGDDDLALEYLQKAYLLYPDGLDSNYFLGDYWLAEENFDKAIFHLEKAQKAPVRPYHQLSDTKVKREVEKALKAAKNHDSSHGDFFSSFLPDFEE
jgi:tetratricopeptide (TPR) repeat protein